MSHSIYNLLPREEIESIIAKEIRCLNSVSEKYGDDTANKIISDKSDKFDFLILPSLKFYEYALYLNSSKDTKFNSIVFNNFIYSKKEDFLKAVSEHFWTEKLKYIEICLFRMLLKNT